MDGNVFVIILETFILYIYTDRDEAKEKELALLEAMCSQLRIIYL